MKQICGLLLSICLIPALCACGQKADTSAPADAPTWQEQYDLGIRYLSEGNYEEAIIAFTAAIEIDPKRPEGYSGLAEAYLALDDQEKAIAALEDGVAATGDGDLEAYLEQLQAGPLTALAYQAAYEPDGTICISIRYFYNEAGYLIRSETQNYDESGNATSVSVETWEHNAETGKSIHTRPDGTQEEPYIMSPGTWQRCSSIANICTKPATREDVGEDGILENWNSDPVNMNPRFDYAVYTFDEAGYPLTITTYGYEGEVIGTAVAEWTTIYPTL